MTVEELRAKREALKTEARALLDKEDRTDADLTRAEEIAKHEIPSLDREIAVTEQLEATRAKLEKVLDEPEERSARPEISGVHERVQDDPKRGFTHPGEFFQLVHRCSVESATNEEKAQLRAATGMSQAVAADGGILVPPAFADGIWDALNNPADSLLPQTDQYTVEGYESITFKANAETSRATGSRYGGVRGYWLAEAGAITSSKPTFRDMKLEPHELGVLVYVTDKLLRNASSLGQHVTRGASDEINFLVGDAIVNGTGAGQPKGLVNAGSKVEVAKETSQVAATIVQENLSKMWARLHPKCRANAIWLYNVDCEPQFDILSVKVKNVAGSENVGGLSTGIYNPDKQTIKGRPMVPCEYCATLGTAGDIILTDLGYYATATWSGGIKAASSIHVKFTQAETAFRFMFAVDGDSWLNSAITPFKGSNTLTNVVTLAVRS